MVHWEMVKSIKDNATSFPRLKRWKGSAGFMCVIFQAPIALPEKWGEKGFHQWALCSRIKTFLKLCRPKNTMITGPSTQVFICHLEDFYPSDLDKTNIFSIVCIKIAREDFKKISFSYGLIGFKDQANGASLTRDFLFKTVSQSTLSLFRFTI